VTIALLGVTGYTGRLVAAALDRRGLPFLAAGRDHARVSEAVEGLSHVAGTRVADTGDRASLRALADEADVLITTVGPFVEHGRAVLDAAIAGRCHYVDSTGEQSFLRWAYDHAAPRARDAGITAVPAAGFDFVPGDTTAHIAAGHVDAAVEAHIAYLASGPGLPLSWTSRGTRASIKGILTDQPVSLVDGELVAEGFASQRRLAWFPKPVGPRHAANLGGLEPLSVPGHVPTVRTVRTYIAMPSVIAELAQAGARIARLGPIAALTGRVLDRGGDPTLARRQATRWAVVAEVKGADGAIARAWANGTDLYGFTGESMATIAGRLDSAPPRAVGVVAPSSACDAVDLLDDLADATGMRWSTKAPVSG